LAGLATGESARPTSKVDQADCLAREEGLVTDSSIPAQQKCKFYASAVLEYENYAHRRHSQMFVKLTCWPFDFHASEHAEFEIRQTNQWCQGKYQDKLLVIFLNIKTYQRLVAPLVENHHRFQHVILHELQYGQAK
jgi:hypothetical protein